MGIPVKVRVTMLSAEGLSVGDLLDFASCYYRHSGLEFSCRILEIGGEEESLNFSVAGGSLSLFKACSALQIFNAPSRCRIEGGIGLVFDVGNEFHKIIRIPFDVEFISNSVVDFVSMVRTFPVPHFDYFTSRVARPSCVGILNSQDFEHQSDKGQEYYKKECLRLAHVYSEVNKFFFACDQVCVAAFHGNEDRDDYAKGLNRLYGIPYNSIVLEKNGIPSRLFVELECPRELAEQFVKFDRQGCRKPFFLSSWDYFSTEVRVEKVNAFLVGLNEEIQKIEFGFRKIEFEDVNFSDEEIVEARRVGYQKYWPDLFCES